MATQLLASSKFTKTTKKPNLFNAVLHDRARAAHDDNTRISGGKAALGALSKEISEENSWRYLPKDEQRRLIQNLEAYKKEKEDQKVEKVLPAHQGNDIERTMVGVNAEVKEACISLFKCTPEQMALQVEAFITSGLAGTIKLAGKGQPAKIRGEIRALIVDGLQDIVKKKNELEGVPDGDVPATMNYDSYEDRVVCKWGVELVGWTENMIENPAKLTTLLSLRRLYAALRSGDCYWSILSDEAWTLRKEARSKRISEGKAIARKKRSDAGVSKKAAGKKKGSAAVVDSDSDDGSDD
ncbi:hypothetical protein HWV62_1296 [Athelia sp. TMB]|nr:hypothetical protein HWV62_1296 [Athelia sp. TMB]